MNRIYILTLSIISLFLAACTADVHEPVEATESAPEPTELAAPAAARPAAEPMCGEGEPKVDRPLTPDALCDWSTSADLIVWGTIDNIRDLDAPLARAGTAIPPEYREWELAKDCDTEIEPTMAFDLLVKGTLKGEAADRVTVRMGLMQAAGLRALNKSSHGALTEGETVAVVLHRLEEFDAWSLMGEPIVRLDDDGRTFLQGPPQSRRKIRQVEGLSGLTFPELSAQVSQCVATDHGIGRRERLVRKWGPDIRKRNRPTKYIAAWCKTDHSRKLPAGTCYSDFDCEEQEGTFCNECAGRCEVLQEGWCLADVDCPTRGERCNRCTGQCSPKIAR